MDTQDIILKNKQGVKILESNKYAGHYTASDCCCECGNELIVAPNIFHPKHEPGNPVMICSDHGVCAYQFSDLVIGKQDGSKRL